jgi:hypothetical protein
MASATTILAFSRQLVPFHFDSTRRVFNTVMLALWDFQEVGWAKSEPDAFL